MLRRLMRPTRWNGSLFALVLVASGWNAARAADTSLKQALTLLNAHQYREAAVLSEKVVKSARTNSAEQAKAYVCWGTCLLRRKQYEPAIERFTQGLACSGINDGDRVQAEVNKGYCLRQTDDLPKAIEHFHRVVADPAASPRSRSDASLYCASTYFKLGQVDEALKQLRYVTRQTDTQPYLRASAWLGIGRALAARGDFEDAREAYQSALEQGETGTKSAAARTELIELELLSRPDTALFVLPWLTRVSDQDATLHWVAKGDVAAARVTVNDPAVSVHVEQLCEIHHGFFLFEAKLHGLSPARRYEYEVRSTNATQDGSFVTPSPNDEALTFCVLGDTQSRSQVHTKIARHLAAQRPEFVLHAGDCVERGTEWLQWQTQVFMPGRPYLELAPLYPARGNHDGGGYFPRLFGLLDRQYYSFERGLVHVAALDAFGPHSSEAGLKQQAAWLDKDLAATQAPWKVVIVHDPMVNADLVNSWWGLDTLMPVIEKHGVAVVFSGHHHRYRRFLPLHPPGHPNAGATWHITTGGSGGTLSGPFVSPLTVRGDLIHHFVRVDVDPQQMRMKVIDIDGNAIDKITLRRNDDGTIGSDTEQPVDRAHAEQIITFFTALSPYKRPDALTARYEENKIIVDFATLPCGVLDTSDYPAEFRVTVAAAEDCAWQVEPADLAIRGLRELRIAVKPPSGPAPLRLKFQPRLDKRELIPHTFEVVILDGAKR